MSGNIGGMRGVLVGTPVPGRGVIRGKVAYRLRRRGEFVVDRALEHEGCGVAHGCRLATAPFSMKRVKEWVQTRPAESLSWPGPQCIQLRRDRLPVVVVVVVVVLLYLNDSLGKELAGGVGIGLVLVSNVALF
jgi:hypothetical protein